MENESSPRPHKLPTKSLGESKSLGDNVIDKGGGIYIPVKDTK